MKIEINLFRFLTELLILTNIFLFLIDIPITIYGTNKFGVDTEGNLEVKEMLKEKQYFEWFWKKLLIIIIPLLLLIPAVKNIDNRIVLGVIMGFNLVLYNYITPIIINWILRLV